MISYKEVPQYNDMAQSYVDFIILYTCEECSHEWGNSYFFKYLTCPKCGHSSDVYSVGDARAIIK